MPDLSKIGKREELKPNANKEPHWQRLHAGCYIGFRPSKRGGKGTWIARAFDEDTGKYSRKALGDYGALTGNDVFTQAKKDAEAWAELVETGGTPSEKLETVADACRAYLEEKPGSIAEGVFRRHVYKDPIAKVKLDKLRRRHTKEWRKRLENAPALVGRRKLGKNETKERSAATVNRDMVPLRAALGRVLPLGAPNTEAAWQEALKPAKGADRRRDLYLDRDERKKLLEAADPEVHPFLRGLCLLPLRPGALAGLRTGDFDKRTRTLTIGKDKNGKPRQIMLPQSVSDFLVERIKGKLPAAYIFSRDDGRRWEKDGWKVPIKDAVTRAGLPTGATAYTLRHCVLTDLVVARLPLLTVAQISDTSVQMIERHYGHLVGDEAVRALDTLAI
ncbi:tyrosine-type recombinase/integrase [Sphingomonas pruni]|uniref:tyrosine-type recombinase/integrase n=1 Tax=Sphingomonas pruni TaxID=40683 RepID=UPI000A99D4E0|nr:tyrosine-type recombinase/integrase [Sphingomonas pruni]